MWQWHVVKVEFYLGNILPLLLSLSLLWQQTSVLLLLLLVVVVEERLKRAKEERSCFILHFVLHFLLGIEYAFFFSCSLFQWKLSTRRNCLTSPIISLCGGDLGLIVVETGAKNVASVSLPRYIRSWTEESEIELRSRMGWWWWGTGERSRRV